MGGSRLEETGICVFMFINNAPVWSQQRNCLILFINLINVTFMHEKMELIKNWKNEKYLFSCFTLTWLNPLCPFLEEFLSSKSYYIEQKEKYLK